MSAGNDDLHDFFEALLRGVRDLEERLQEAKGELRKIREAVVNGFSNLQDAIYDSIEAQAELKMMDHMMEARAIKPQIDAERERLEREQSELDERLAEIDERFERRHDELEAKAVERIRNLGEHIFDIRESQFEDSIERPFVSHVTPAWRDLSVHNERIGTKRQKRIQSVTDETVQEIQAFIDRQEALLEEIDRNRHDDDRLRVTDDGIERIQIPYYSVHYRDKNSGTETESTEIVAPSVQTRASGISLSSEWVSTKLEPIEGADQLVSDDQKTVDDPADVKTVSAEKITRTLADDSSTAGSLVPGLSYTDLVADTIDGGVRVQSEAEERWQK
jgi:hypothetical protein